MVRKPHIRLVNGFWCAFNGRTGHRPVVKSRSFKSLCYAAKIKFGMLNNQMRT